MQSPDNTVISTPGQSIVDASGNVWTLDNGQVAVNGAADPSTVNVIQMAYENGLIWQKNGDNLWWSTTAPSAGWDPPYGTAVDPIPGQVASASGSIVTGGEATGQITDASGNAWSISGGQVTLNGVADPTTANVIELAYVDGMVWQENASQLWWSKTLPSDPWGPPYGTATDPVPDVTRTWTGGIGSFAVAADWSPFGVPQAGDTAVIGSSGEVKVPAGAGSDVNFDLQGGGLQFTEAGSFATGTWAGSGSVLIGYPGQPVTVTTTGIDLAGGQLQVSLFVNDDAHWMIDGNSSLTDGAVLDAQDTGTASLPRADLQNDGTMVVNAATLAVGNLTGQGVVEATGGSSVTVLTASASETIALMAGHLYVGGAPIYASTAMQFLAPVTQFGATSAITFDDTQATSAVFEKSAATAGQFLLYDGASLVADVSISGQAHIYASDTPNGSAPGSVTLTAYDTGHSIPVTTGGV